MAATVQVKSKDQGSHGDHWAGIFGFEHFFNNANNVQHLVMEFAEFAVEQYKSTPAEVFNIPIADGIYATVVLEAGEFKTVYPLILSDRIINTITQTVEPWIQTGDNEAQVLAEGAGTYLLDYFATDYRSHRERYVETAEHTSILSGVIYNVIDAVGIEGFSEEFTGFWPHPDYPGSSLYQFRGLIEDIAKSANPDLFIDGYVLSLKLAAAEGGNDLVVDAFLSFDNIHTDNVQKGNYVSGVLWLQGRINAQ